MKTVAYLAAFFSALAFGAPVTKDTTKYIISFKDGIDVQAHTAWVAETFEANLAKRGLSKRDFGGIEQVYRVVPAYTGFFDDATLEALRANPDVVAVEEDGIASIPEGELNGANNAAEKRALTTQSGAPYGLDAISHRAGARGGSSYIYDTSAGAGTFAYVIDTGINTGHQQFGGRAVQGFSSFGGSSVDDNGHGTHCAGTIGSAAYGVAKSATLVAVKVLSSQGSGSFSGIINGIDWAISDARSKGRIGKTVFSMSLGGGFNQGVNNAVTTAVNNGIPVAVAAGNSNADAANFSPASAPAAITVGAVTTGNTRASYSNFGSVLDVFAVGSNVLSTWIGSSTATNTISGTSMATPHVAGLALYLMALEGITSPAAVANRITALATNGIVGSAGNGSPNRLAYNGNGA